MIAEIGHNPLDGFETKARGSRCRDAVTSVRCASRSFDRRAANGSFPPILPLLSRCSFRLPQIVEPVRSHPRVVRCVPGVTVSEIVLNDSQIVPLVRQGETAGMA